MPYNLFQAVAKALSFEFPQGDILFSNISFSLQRERYGLVGPNGAGKSTLAQLLAGRLHPTRGDLKVSHPVCYLAQNEEAPSGTVSDYLIELWESPFASPELWGPLLADIPLERRLDTLSGGQWTRVRIANALSQNSGLLILDEPTNNLDRSARQVIVEFVKAYKEPLLLISHDRELLNHVDKILEISSQGLSVYGGNHAFYLEQRAKERELQEFKMERARREKKRVERELHEKVDAQEKRMRTGKKVADSGSLPRILIGGRKRRAQETLGKIAKNEDRRVESAQEELREIFSNVKQESFLGLSLPETSVPEGKLIFELNDVNVTYRGQEHAVWSAPISLIMKGPRRVAIAGDNGTGKSTLIKTLMNPQSEEFKYAGEVKVGDLPKALLDQNYSILEKEKSVLENVMQSSRYDLIDSRNLLARFQFMGEKSLQSVKTLSGGEQLKAALAKILLAKPAPQFLILDEPTNNLDLVSLEILEAALSDYQGALLVISHDEEFLRNIGIQEVCVLQSDPVR